MDTPTPTDKQIATEVAILVARSAKARKVVAQLYADFGAMDPVIVRDIVNNSTMTDWNEFAVRAGLRSVSPQTVALVLWQLAEHQVAATV